MSEPAMCLMITHRSETTGRLNTESDPIKAVQLIGKRICGCLLYKLKLTQLLLIMSERKSRILE